MFKARETEDWGSFSPETSEAMEQEENGKETC